MDFELFIKEQFAPLVKRVEDLEKKLKGERDEKEKLLNKICELEDQIEHLNDTVKKIQQKELDNEKREKLKNVRQETEESWLFYCKRGLSVTEIALSLKMLNYKAIELNCNTWYSEELMWIELLTKLDIHRSELEGKDLRRLKEQGSIYLSNALRDQMIIIARNLPTDDKQFDAKISHLTSLCETITDIWNELEMVGNDHMLGYMAVILESEKPIDVVCIEKEESKIYLYVEPLK